MSRAIFSLLFPVSILGMLADAIVKTLDNFIAVTAITSFQTLFAKRDRGEDEYFRIQHTVPTTLTMKIIVNNNRRWMDGVQSVLSLLLSSAAYPSL